MSLAFHQLDATGEKTSKGHKLWSLDAVKIRKINMVKQKGGEPRIVMSFYIKRGIKNLADWCAAAPGWTGAIVLESVEKSLFDGFEEAAE